MRTPRLRSCLCLLGFAFTATFARAATVTTLPATAITVGSATLNAMANPGGISSFGSFDYGVTTNYGNSTSSQALGGTGNINFSQPVTGLAGGPTYHCRARLTSSFFGTVLGNDQTFSIPLAPLAITGAATAVHPGQATLNATITPDTEAAVYWFQHGPTTNYGSFTATNQLAAGTTAVAVSNLLTGLPRGVPYHFRAVATNALGQSVGADVSFTVPQGPTGPSGSVGDGLAFDIQQPALELNFIICTNGVFLGSGGGAVRIPFLGEICLFAGNFAPAGWTFCQGQLLDISMNTSLYSVFGTFYGGDGITNFALPDLRGYGPVDAGQGVGLTSWVVSQKTGTTQETLSVQEMPAHAHSLPPPDGATGTNGGGQPRNNIKPSLALTYMIVLTGIYPIQGGTSIFEPFLGQIMLFAGDYAPNGTALVAGQNLTINQEQAMYALLGTNYGGNGQTIFELPNLQSRLPIGIGQGQLSLWSLGQQTGVEYLAITQAQMPAHQHTVPAFGTLTGFTGSNQPQTLMQPSMALQFLISTNGQVPSTTVEATNTMLGEIQLYAGTNLSVVGWLPCDGRLLPIAGSPALFGVISNYYGGDGITTFALPNLSGRAPVGSTNGQPGAAYGAEQTVLTVANLPPHTHTVPLPDFDRWITSFGLSGAVAGFTADADADNAGNGYEWATGTNPTNAQSIAPLTINLAGGKVSVGFPRNTNATDVVFTLLRSTNLANPGAWTGIATNLAGAWSPPAIVTETGAANPVNVTISPPLTNAPTANYRLQITWP